MRDKTNENGELVLGGIPALALAKEYGTPLYVMDSDLIVSQMQRFTSALSKYYNGNGLICYASKAFCCKRMCNIADENGLGLDIVSIGELYTALSAGFDMEKVCLHGNNKTISELQFALELGVGCIVVDNPSELAMLDEICKNSRKRADIMLRIKPGIDAHSHSYVCTGQIDSKFGIALETGEAMAAVKQALGMDGVRLMGLHCHIGSQILTDKPYKLAVEAMVKFMAEIKAETGVTLPQLNLGGGFGISYTQDENELDIEQCIKLISDCLAAECAAHNLPKPFLMLEPGRSIVAAAGTTLYTVGSVKHIPNVRTYVAVDGGMTDNPRYALYQSKYEMTVAGKAGRPKDTVVTVAGKCCESGDLLGTDIPLQAANVGDTLAVFCTGAYNFSMFSHYNRTPRPPVVEISKKAHTLMVRGDTLDDLIQNDI